MTAASSTPGQEVGDEVGAEGAATKGSGGGSGSAKGTEDDDAEGEEDDEEEDGIPINIPRQVHRVGKKSIHRIIPPSSEASGNEEDPGRTDGSGAGANLNVPASPTPATVQPSHGLSDVPPSTITPTNAPPSTALRTDKVLPPDEMDLDPAPAGANRRSIDDVEDMLGPRRSKYLNRLVSA